MPVTRLGLEGYGVRRAGSFAAKTPSGSAHPVSVLTRLGLDGYGVRRNGSFAGKTGGAHPVSILTRLGLDGYGVRRDGGFSGKTPGAQTPPVITGGAGGLITFRSYNSKQALSDKVRLALELKQKKKKLSTVQRKITFAERKAQKKLEQSEPTQEILANLYLLRERRAELRSDIEVTAVNLQAAIDFLRGLEFDDEDDVDILSLFG